jgi:acetylornithine deacetylase/succinyl-diaminopimelate desuccinylase-like protein
MGAMTWDFAHKLISDLIGLQTVNPMGRPWSGEQPVERPVVEYLEALFSGTGVQLQREPVSEMHENLRITIPGESDAPALLFESHIDTVPADEWLSTAFQPRTVGDMVFGRGACDDKGCLTAMTMAVLDIVRSGRRPPRTLIFLAAGDEEYSQTGIRWFRNRNIPVGRAIFGEPTGLVPVVQHRGTLRWDVTVQGRSAHTARRELGVNAIDGAMELIAALKEWERRVRVEFPPGFTPGPALTVTRIEGGRTRNAVPDLCTFSVDYRLAPGMSWESAWEGVKRYLSTFGWEVRHEAPQMTTPALSTDPDDPFSLEVLRVCRAVAGSEIELAGMPYGTDASWISDRAPALVLGPGDIAWAHAIDERVPVTEIVNCARIYRDIALLADA